ncbi:molybdopterin-guanine dinucleotide biosynthesis protein B [Paenibacillus sp. y28]|uniref:molybdopterin-guanine dinucleotide biosynthesis protein B n=1 Tax=Paenibacillus sp. y28 TaxID=3129110 RepID=UPI0030193950
MGYKNSGKTTLACRLIKRLVTMGLQTAVIKHHGHEAETEPNGCDTRRQREAGAVWSAIASPVQTAIVHEAPFSLDMLIRQVPPTIDFILVEGFKREAYPKLLLARESSDLQFIHELKGLTGVGLWPELYARHTELSLPEGLAVFHIEEPGSIAAHVLLQFPQPLTPA